MKIGIISDIHGNLPALQAVLAHLQAEQCVKIICAGDVVGYGAQPAECIELLRERGIPCVRGNHDHMVAYPGRELKLRQEVQTAIQWTREQLNSNDVQWLGELPSIILYGGVSVIHASHAFRPEWHYTVDERSIAASFLFQTNAITFNGHTHLPFLASHQRGERPILARLRESNLLPGCRYLVNVGSVGQPRDRRPQAACAVFQTRCRQVTVHRVDYDIAAAQKSIEEAGLPSFFATRLAVGR